MYEEEGESLLGKSWWHFRRQEDVGRPSLALKELLDLGEAQSVYFNYFGRTRGGPVGIL